MMSAQGPLRTLAVNALPAGKDRADFLDFLRANHDTGFERMIFHYDDRILVIYKTPQDARVALESIASSTTIVITYAEEDYIWQEMPPNNASPNSVLYLPPTGSPLSAEEIEKILKCYRGFELFDILESDDLRDKRHVEKSARSKPSVQKYFAIFRDVFCAEDAMDDLLEHTNIPATFSHSHERVRTIMERRAAAKPSHASFQPPPETPMRLQPQVLTWVHLSAIPDDLSYAKLKSHVVRMKGFKCMSLQPDGLCLGFENEQFGKTAAEHFMKNTRMEVMPAPAEIVQSMNPIISRSTSAPRTSVLYLTLPSWLPIVRITEILQGYSGLQELKPEYGQLLARFYDTDHAFQALRDLESTTDLIIEFGPETLGGAMSNLVDSPTMSPTRDSISASPHLVAQGRPRADSILSAASINAAPFAASEAMPVDPYDVPTGTLQPSFAIEKPPSDSAIFISASDLPHVKFSLRHSIGSLEGFERICFQEEGFYAWFETRDQAARAVGRMEGEKHVTPTLIKKAQPRTRPPPIKPPTSDTYAGALFVRCPWSLSIDGLQAILESYPGYMTCRHLRDSIIVDYVNHAYAAKATKDLRDFTNIRVEYSNRSAQPGNRYMVDDKEDTMKGEASGRATPAVTRYAVENRDTTTKYDYASRPPSAAARYSADEKPPIVKSDYNNRFAAPISNRSPAEEKDFSAPKPEINKRYSQQSNQSLVEQPLLSWEAPVPPKLPPIETRVQEWENAVRCETPLHERPPVANPMGTRTLFVGSLGASDKADIKAICAALPGFQRMRFGVGSFRAIFEDACHAAEAVTTLRSVASHWRANFSKKELEGVTRTLPGEPSNAIQTITLHWSEVELLKLFKTYPGFESLNYEPARSRITFKDKESAEHALTDLNASTDLVSVFPGRRVHTVRSTSSLSSNPQQNSSNSLSDLNSQLHAWDTNSVSAQSESSPQKSQSQACNPEDTPLKPMSGVAVSLFNGMNPQKMGAMSDAEHFPARQVEQSWPYEIMTNVVSIRNIAPGIGQELIEELQKFPNFVTAVQQNEDNLWYAKFKDVASAATVYQSYELRERLGKGFGGVTFQYCGKGAVPNEWEDELIEVTPVSRSAEGTEQVQVPRGKAPTSTVEKAVDPWALPPNQSVLPVVKDGSFWSNSAPTSAPATGWPVATTAFVPWDISQPFGSVEEELNRIKGPKPSVTSALAPVKPSGWLNPNAPAFEITSSETGKVTTDKWLGNSVEYDDLVGKPQVTGSAPNPSHGVIETAPGAESVIPDGVSDIARLRNHVAKAHSALDQVITLLVKMGGQELGDAPQAQNGPLMNCAIRIVNLAKSLKTEEESYSFII